MCKKEIDTTLMYKGATCSFVNVIIVLVLCVFVGRFASLAFPSVDMPFQFLCIFCSLLSAALVFNKSKISRVVYLYLLVLLAVFAVQFVYTVVLIGQTPFHFFSAVYTYSFCLLVFPFSFLFSELGDRAVFSILQKAVIAISLIMILSALVKNCAGLNLIEAMRERGSSARLGEPEFVDVMVIYSCWMMGTARRRTLDLFCLILGLLTIFYVSQTRVMEIVILCSCFLTLLMSFRGANKKALLVCIGFFAALTIVLSGSFDEFVSSFSLNGAEADSTIARQEETAYYLSAFCRKPLVGLGMIAYESPLHYLIGGPYGNFYPDDIGIIGALGTIGLLIIPLYIIPVVLFVISTIKACHAVKSLQMGLIVYLIGTSATLLIVYPFCSPVWPFLIAEFDYCKSKNFTNNSGV